MRQDAIVQTLLDPATYPHRPASVEHVQTHISHVFLAGSWVYKLKKAVVLPFLDFGTLERRHHFCDEEVRLNQRLCPGVYERVLPVTRDAGGRVHLDGPGEPIEFVVVMRRLPAERLLTALLARDAVTDAMVRALAARLTAFHATARRGPEVAAHGDPTRLLAQWEENVTGIAPFVGRHLTAEEHAILTDFGPSFVRTHETLLRARQRAGHVCEGHGDLHAEHVCFLDAPAARTLDVPPGVYVFDCIEFTERFRCLDVASEIAFLAMDLEHLGRSDLARRFVEAYATAADDRTLGTVVPFYAAHRACIRGKVEGLRSDEPEVPAADRAAAATHARAYFAQALRHVWSVDGPALIACAGLSGTGKTTIARALSDVTGFVHLSTDVLRRRAAGLGPRAEARSPVDTGLYTEAARAATYVALAEEAERALAGGRGVIVDATFVRRADRERLRAVARGRSLPCIFLRCLAPEPTLHARLAARTTAASGSDARWDTYVAQRQAEDPWGAGEPHVDLPTGQEAPAARAAALRIVWAWRRGRPVAATDDGPSES